MAEAPGGAEQGRISTPSTRPLGCVFETATCVQEPGANPCMLVHDSRMMRNQINDSLSRMENAIFFIQLQLDAAMNSL